MINELDNLNNIQKVEVSPFLYTRILQKIENKQQKNYSPKLIMTIVSSFSIIVILNIVAIGYQFRKINYESYLNPIFIDNTLYNE